MLCQSVFFWHGPKKKTGVLECRAPPFFMTTPSPPMALRVVPSLYKRKGVDGDFAYMMTQPEHKDSMFLICTNFYMMLTSRKPQAGTAVLMPFTYDPSHLERGEPLEERPHSAGIPTGWSVHTMGFRSLPDDDVDYVKEAIDYSFHLLHILLIYFRDIKKKPYDKVIFSADPADPSKIGMNGIFGKTLGQDVVDYVSLKIQSLTDYAFCCTWKDWPAHIFDKQLKKTMTKLRKLNLHAAALNGWAKAQVELREYHLKNPRTAIMAKQKQLTLTAFRKRPLVKEEDDDDEW